MKSPDNGLRSEWLRPENLKSQAQERQDVAKTAESLNKPEFMTTIELKAEANRLHAVEHTARRADDAVSMLQILESLTHNYRLQLLNKEQDNQEAGWTPKLPTIEPLDPVMSAEELKHRLA